MSLGIAAMAEHSVAVARVRGWPQEKAVTSGTPRTSYRRLNTSRRSARSAASIPYTKPFESPIPISKSSSFQSFITNLSIHLDPPPLAEGQHRRQAEQPGQKHGHQLRKSRHRGRAGRDGNGVRAVERH